MGSDREPTIYVGYLYKITIKKLNFNVKFLTIFKRFLFEIFKNP